MTMGEITRGELVISPEPRLSIGGGYRNREVCHREYRVREEKSFEVKLTLIFYYRKTLYFIIHLRAENPSRQPIFFPSS
jgi:hypothetical protein